MNPLTFAILTFGCVALLVWGASRKVFGGESDNRRRLKLRLSGLSNQPSRGQPLQEQSTLLMQQSNAKALGELLGRYHFFRELRKSLKQSMPGVTLEKFVVVAGGVGVGLSLVALLLSGSFIVAGVALLVGLYLPFVVVERKKGKRQKMLAEQLPDGLDFLGRSLRAGHSLPIGLQMMGTELPAPLSEEFGRCYDEVSLGTGADVALKAMVERIDSTDFAFFVTAVLVQRQTGGDLAQVLDNITGMLRQRIQLQQQVRAKTAEGRFTGLILAAFPMIMFLILMVMSRPYAEVLITQTLGKIFLGGALFLSGLGLFVIKKITTVRV